MMKRARATGSSRSSVIRYGFATCLALLVGAGAWAQEPVGTISGAVHDQSGAIVPGASITIRNTATGVEPALTSGTDGGFSAPALAAGEYKVIAELAGFRTLQRDVTVATGSVLTVDLRMEVGRASEVVSVSGVATHIELETHAIDGVSTRQEIPELPLN